MQSEPSPASSDPCGSHVHVPLALSELCVDAATDTAATHTCRTRVRIEFASMPCASDPQAGELVTFKESHDQEVAVYCEDRLIARGTLVTTADRVGVRLTSVVTADIHREAA